MWWGVVYVLVSHFHQDMASLEESEYPQHLNPFLKYGQILDFIDSHYGDVSAPKANFLNLGKHHKDRVRRRDDTIIPLTPMPKDGISKYMDQRESGATSHGDNFPMYNDHNVDTVVATTAKGVGKGLRKPRDDYGLLIEPIQKPINAENILRSYFTVPTRKTTDIAGQAFSRSTERQLKYFDVANPLNNYDTIPARRTTNLHVKSYFDGVTEQATIGARPIATIQETTPSALNTTSQYIPKDTEFDIEMEQATMGARPTVTNQDITLVITTDSRNLPKDTDGKIKLDQATIGARSTATNQDTTLVLTIDSHNLPKDTESDISIEHSNDVTDLTRKTLNYHNTVKEDTTHRIEKTVDYHTAVKEDNTFRTTPVIAESTTNAKTQMPQTTVKEITWPVETIATVIDNTLLENSLVLDNVLYSETTNLVITSTTTEAVLDSSITQITPTRSAAVKNTVESTAVNISTIGIEKSTQNFGTDESTQSTFVEPTEVTVYMPIEKDSPDQVVKLRFLGIPSTTEDYSDRKIDVPELLKMLDAVVYDDPNRFNLTQKFNESLQKYNIPTCETFQMPTTTESPSTINFNDARVVAKCFVCGLDVEGVPYSSACADAFAGDFIPLVPVDPKARGQIARYRKYCRYLDVNRVILTEEEPHSVFGRFTGGCSVRWVDLTSIYTQRSCRNRRRAVMGKHFASKRMAKLEMALNDVDNGCIISPVATLLPLSRGISLYARFHACVCTGSWCNRATFTTQWMSSNLIMFVFVSKVS